MSSPKNSFLKYANEEMEKDPELAITFTKVKPTKKGAAGQTAKTRPRRHARRRPRPNRVRGLRPDVAVRPQLAVCP